MKVMDMVQLWPVAPAIIGLFYAFSRSWAIALIMVVVSGAAYFFFQQLALGVHGGAQMVVTTIATILIAFDVGALVGLLGRLMIRSWH